MLTLMVTALTETLVKYMFNKYLDEIDRVDIGGAPSWYMKEIDDEMCVFTHSNKNKYSSIEIAKDNSKIKMVKKIDKLVDIIVYKNYKNITNSKEKELIERWREDEHLLIFVDKNLDYNRVVYEKDVKTTFIRACIEKNIIIDYEKARVWKIKKQILKSRTDTAMNEMESQTQNKNFNYDKNDPYSELDNETSKFIK